MHAQSSHTRFPLYHHHLHDHWAQQIATNHWRPEETIPTEAALSTEYQQSTGSVCKAVQAVVNEGLRDRQQGRGTFFRRRQFQSSLFRFIRFHTAAGKRQIPERRIFSIEPLSAPLGVAQALGLSADAQVIRIIRVRVLNGQPFFGEEIWLLSASFRALLDINFSVGGTALPQPTKRSVAGLWLMPNAEESLTAQSAGDVIAPLLQIRVSIPVVVIERLCRHPLDVASLPRACQIFSLRRRHP